MTENDQQQVPSTRKKKARQVPGLEYGVTQGFRTPVAGIKTRGYDNMGIYEYHKLYIFQLITNLLTQIYSQSLALYTKKSPKILLPIPFVLHQVGGYHDVPY